MADELSISASTAYSKSLTAGTLKVPSLAVSGQVDVATAAVVDLITVAPVAGGIIAAADFGGMAGYLFVQNLGPTNYIEVGLATGTYTVAKLLAGEFMLLRMNSWADLALRANTAECNVIVRVFSL